MWQCHYCGATLSLQVQQKNRLCPQCNSDLHCCKNCSHYQENTTSKCNEPNSPWVRDRAAQNNCEYFEFRALVTPTSDPAVDAQEAEEAKKAFRALFRDA